MAIDTETMQLIERIVARSIANATSLKGAAGEIAKGVTQYVGARYVPLFAEPLEWDETKAYEPLTIVLHQGNSYTSRQYVPVGVEIDNDSFWALTGNYNAQVEQYRQEVKAFDGRITANANAIETETTDRVAAVTAEIGRAQSAEQTLQANIDAENTRAAEAEQTLQANINAEKTRATEAEQTLQANINAEKTRATEAEQTLQANINTEKTRATGAENAINERLVSTDANVVSLSNAIGKLSSTTPLFVDSIGNMTDTSRIYVLSPSGNVYTYNGESWVDSGVKYGESNAVVFKGNITASNITAPYDDLNTVPANTIIQYSTTDIKNMPEKQSGELFSFGLNNYKAQIYAPLYGSRDYFWYRICGEFIGSWIKISEVPDSIDYENLLSMYNTLVMCGDSLTYCQVYTGDNASRQAYKTWPSIVAKDAGCDFKEFATPGFTAAQWFDQYNTDAIQQRTNQLFIIYLGTNAGLTDTIDTDCPESATSDSWADTNTGCYGKMLEGIKNIGAKALLLKPWTTTGNLSTTKKVIDDFAKRYNFASLQVENIDDSCYHRWPSGTGVNSVHFNDLGYAKFAYALINWIGKLSPDEKDKLF